MAKYSKSEFATKCGMGSNGLSVYIKRGKVILENGEIDDTTPQNQLFLANHSKGVKQLSISAPKKTKSEKAESVEQSVEEAMSLDNERKKIEIERAELNRQLLLAKLGQQSGKVIPVEAVKLALEQHFKDITVYVGQGLKNLSDEICRKANWDIVKKSEMNASMQKILNDSVNRAIDATTGSLRNLQKEYSMKRGVGEK